MRGRDLNYFCLHAFLPNQATVQDYHHVRQHTQTKLLIQTYNGNGIRYGVGKMVVDTLGF